MTRQTPLWIQAGSYPASLDRQLIAAALSSGAEGCAVTPASAMTVNIAAGKIVVPVTGGGSALCVTDAVEQVTLAAAPASGSNRYDLVIATVRANDLDGGANNDWLFSTVTGAAAASPTVPALPANSYALATIYVAGGSAAIVVGNITDTRRPPRPWYAAWGVPQGGEAVVTTGQNLNAGTYDITGLVVTFMAWPGRQYRAMGQIGQHSFNAAGQVQWFISDGANNVKGSILYGGGNVPIAQYSTSWRVPLITYPSAGLQTLKVRAISGSADLRIAATPSQANLLTVEDVGPIPGQLPQ